MHNCEEVVASTSFLVSSLPCETETAGGRTVSIQEEEEEDETTQYNGPLCFRVCAWVDCGERGVEMETLTGRQSR